MLDSAVDKARLWRQAILVSILIPGVAGVLIPLLLTEFEPPMPGVWSVGWLLFALGVALYVRCVRSFVAVGGTPAMFLTRAASRFVGSEPPMLVRSDVYRLSRNPMYVGVLLVVAGQAIGFASWPIAAYGLVLAIGFHWIVTKLEEPHLRRKYGDGFDAYVQSVPRWFVKRAARRHVEAGNQMVRGFSNPPSKRP